ncbi:mucin-19-like [Penaeus indicus]|uniref:mucin-19-like n=1 Tax=Penaeus indicus TaxID=29960 RepID=UPI00300D8520
MRFVVTAVALVLAMAPAWQPSAARPWQAWQVPPSGTRGGPFPGRQGATAVRGPQVAFQYRGGIDAPQAKAFSHSRPRPQPMAIGKAIDGNAEAQRLEGATGRTIRISDLLPNNELQNNVGGQVRLEDLTAGLPDTYIPGGVGAGSAQISISGPPGLSGADLGASAGVSLGEAVASNFGGAAPSGSLSLGESGGVTLAEATSSFSSGGASDAGISLPGISSSGGAGGSATGVSGNFGGIPDFTDIPSSFGVASPAIPGSPDLSSPGFDNTFSGSQFPSSPVTISSQTNTQFTSDSLLTGGGSPLNERIPENPILPNFGADTPASASILNPVLSSQTSVGDTKSFFGGGNDPIRDLLSKLTLGILDSRSASGGAGGASNSPLGSLLNLDVLGLGRDFIDGLVQMAATNLDSITRETTSGLRLLGDEIQFQGEQSLGNLFRNIQQSGRTVGTVGMNTYRGFLQKQSAVNRFINGIVEDFGDFADKTVNKTISKVVDTVGAVGRFISDIKIGIINALIAKGEAFRGLVEGTLETAGSAVADITSSIRAVAEDNIRAITGIDKRFRRSTHK